VPSRVTLSLERHRAVDNRILGRRLREARKAGGLSQTQAGQALGVDQTWISKAERGERAVLATDLPLLASLYGTTVERLLAPHTPSEAAARANAVAMADVVGEAEERDVPRHPDAAGPPNARFGPSSARFSDTAAPPPGISPAP
jgi:transcriptional regulator with XRE-family HTH domain